MTAAGKHSFAVLAHGESPYLDDCLRSLKGQTSGSEVFVVTGTPSAFIEKAAAAHAVRLTVHEGSRGIASDWSFALQSARTDYVTLAHQDDLYLPGYAAACLNLMTAGPECAVGFTDYYELVNGRYRRYPVNLLVKKLLLCPFLLSPVIRSPLLLKAILSLGNPFCCPSGMYNRRALETFSFSDGFAFNIDWDAWDRIVRRGGAFAYVGRKLVVHRIHAASQTSRCIADGSRAVEERMLFERYWPRPLAWALAAAYALGARSNGEGT